MKKALTIIAIALTLSACGGSKIKPETQSIKNTLRTETIGQMSYTVAPEEEVTDEYLKEWYEIVKPMENTYDIILYEETRYEPLKKGVYRQGSLIEKGVTFTQDEHMDYWIDDQTNAQQIYMDN